jgi:hypothetical protein
VTTSRLKSALGLLGLLAWVAACSADGSVVTAPIEPDAARADAAAQPPPSAYSSAMQTVDALALLPELSRSALEAALGVSLSAPSDGAEVAALEAGPFARVERRAPGGEPADQTRVILDVREGVPLELSEFRASGRIVPSTPFDVNPNLPPEGTLTFRDQTPTQSTLYEFTAQSQRLRSVILVRPPDD